MKTQSSYRVGYFHSIYFLNTKEPSSKKLCVADFYTHFFHFLPLVCGFGNQKTLKPQQGYKIIIEKINNFL